MTEWEVIEANGWDKAKLKAARRLLSPTVRKEYRTLILARGRDFNVMEYCCLPMPYGNWTKLRHGSPSYVIDKAEPETVKGELVEQN